MSNFNAVLYAAGAWFSFMVVTATEGTDLKFATIAALLAAIYLKVSDILKEIKDEEK